MNAILKVISNIVAEHVFNKFLAQKNIGTLSYFQALSRYKEEMFA